MTPDQHAQRIRQIAFQLEKADYGLGMPRDYPRVLELRAMLHEAIKDQRRAMMTTQAWTDEEWDNLCRAAPDLLDLAKDIAGLDHCYLAQGNKAVQQALREWKAAARAAIAKAEGNQ